MGQLVNGQWVTSQGQADKDGAFKRKESSFRNWIEKGGPFPPEKDRYLVYVSLACPWASRVLMMRKLKGLEDIIDLAIVSPLMGDDGWTFEDYPGASKDPIFGAHYLREIYTQVDPHYTGKVTVPVLFDKKEKTIVNNESQEILRMLNTAFNDLTGNTLDFYPQDLREDIDQVNQRVYDHVNNGVYKAGFASKQEIYEKEVQDLFKTLDWLENFLEGKDYLLGDRFTEADIRLFVSLVRFDPVYYGHFKCNLKQIKDYPNLWAYTKRIYALPGVKETVNMDHIKAHYYWSHPSINPTRIIPLGPLEDLDS